MAETCRMVSVYYNFRLPSYSHIILYCSSSFSSLSMLHNTWTLRIVYLLRWLGDDGDLLCNKCTLFSRAFPIYILPSSSCRQVPDMDSIPHDTRPLWYLALFKLSPLFVCPLSDNAFPHFRNSSPVNGSTLFPCILIVLDFISDFHKP